MPYDTRHHEIVTRVLEAGSRIGGRGGTSTGTLQDEGKQIARDEDPGIEAGFDAREFRADFQDAVLEREINPRGEEGRRDDDAADLDFEPVARPRVAVQHDAPHVAQAFGRAAEEERDEVGPGFVADAREQLHGGADAEEGAEEGVGA